MPQVARACAAAGIAWVVLNREVDYISDLRRNYKVPIFSISSDHEEIGRIQGRQIAALLPNGGSVLLIQGPAENLAAKQRTTGMYETKPVEVHVKVMKGNWTAANACKIVNSWLKLSTSQQAGIDIIAAQNDAMAMGARKAFQEIADAGQRERWLALPHLGIDGCNCARGSVKTMDYPLQRLVLRRLRVVASALASCLGSRSRSCPPVGIANDKIIV